MPIYVCARFIFLLSLGYLIVTLTHLWGEHARPQSVIELACDPTLPVLSIDIFLMLSSNQIPADQCAIPAGKPADTDRQEKTRAFSREPKRAEYGADRSITYAHGGKMPWRYLS